MPYYRKPTEIPKVLNRPYNLSVFEGMGLRESLILQCPYLDVEYYIKHHCHDFDAYEKHYTYYVDRRKEYLCDYQELIEIDDSNDNDKIFLSGLVYLAVLTDKFSHTSWCPCSPWNRNWLYLFCPFLNEIPVCKHIEK